MKLKSLFGGNRHQVLTPTMAKSNSKIGIDLKEIRDITEILLKRLSLRKKKENHSKGKNFTCEICKELKHQKKIFENKNTCSHPLCVACITMYIQTKIEDNIAEVKCPWLDCDQLLDPLLCQKIMIAKKGVFVKWCPLGVLGFERCYCPRKIKCSANLVTNECGENNAKKEKCPKCKKMFSFKCVVAWKKCKCKENEEETKKNDLLFMELALKEKWIKCPCCSYYVERVDGCNTVQCRCRAYFCYRCGNNLYLRRSCRCSHIS